MQSLMKNNEFMFNNADSNPLVRSVQTNGWTGKHA